MLIAVRQSREKIKRCKLCNIEFRTLTEDELVKRKEQIKKYKAEYYQKNKKRIAKRCASQRERMKNEDPIGLRRRDFSYFLRWKYGIEIEEYERILKSQEGKCAICGFRPEENASREHKLYVDHNHKTNKVRGLLCMNCNSAIGHFGEDLTSLKKAVEYLQSDTKNEKTSVSSTDCGNPPDSRRG